MEYKEIYAKLCGTATTIPVVQTSWWLDALVGRDHWEVALSFHEGEVIGAFPYFKKNKLGFSIITMPRFSTIMGIWIHYPPNQKYIDKLHYEQAISEELIRQLPAFDYFNQSFYHSYTNWLPFYWRGFDQTTRYTYVLENLDESELLFKEFAHSKRKNISRSSKILSLKEDLSAEEFYELHKTCLDKEGKIIDYSLDLLKRMVAAVDERNGGKLLAAVDEHNVIHAALFTVWNSLSSFNLINPIDPIHRNSGASSFLIKEMIKKVQGKTMRFDFEGSMDVKIAESFRRFGAIQKPYFVISKANSVFMKWFYFLKKL